MTDLAVTEADMQTLSAALVVALRDLAAVQTSLRHMDLSPVGAPPLLEEETAFTRTRFDDLTALGEGITDRHDDVERVGPTLERTDHRIAHNAPRPQ